LATESMKGALRREARLQALAYEITVAEVRERERIASGLHDEIGQLLAVAHFKLNELSHALPADENVQAKWQDLQAALTQAGHAVRSTTFELHSPVLRRLGLQAAIESLGQRMQRSSGIQVHIEGELAPLSAPDAVIAVVFRVVRELMLNVQKHAQARNAWIVMCHLDGQLMIRVSDDGVGFQGSPFMHEFSPNGGFGLYSADAQMQAIGGKLDVQAARGHGAQATVTLPLMNRKEAGEK
jgi:signal transduction histidine kinase